MLNLKILYNPVNWFIIWTMLLIGWFAFHAIRKAYAANTVDNSAS